MNKSDALNHVNQIISNLESNNQPFNARILKYAIDILVSGEDFKSDNDGDKISELTKAINKLILINPAVKEKMYQVQISKISHRVGICKAVNQSKARYIGMKAAGKAKAVKFWDIKVKRVPVFDAIIHKIEPNKLYTIEFIREKAKNEASTKA